VHPRLRLLAERGDLLLQPPRPPLGLKARPGEGALGLVLRAHEDLVRLRPGARDDLVGLGPGARDRIAGLALRAARDVLRLRLGAPGRLLGLLARAGRDLLGGLPRALEDAARLLADAVEGVADRRPRRTADLELGDEAIDPLNVGVDRAAVVAADRCREGRVADVPWHPIRDVSQAAARRRDPGRHIPLAVGPARRLVPSHQPSMTTRKPVVQCPFGRVPNSWQRWSSPAWASVLSLDGNSERTNGKTGLRRPEGDTYAFAARLRRTPGTEPAGD
jgi:hypothetical protein